MLRILNNFCLVLKRLIFEATDSTSSSIIADTELLLLLIVDRLVGDGVKPSSSSSEGMRKNAFNSFASFKLPNAKLEDDKLEELFNFAVDFKRILLVLPPLCKGEAESPESVSLFSDESGIV